MSRSPAPWIVLLTLAALAVGTVGGSRAETVGAFPHLEAWPEDLGLGGIPAALGEGVEAVFDNPTGMIKGEGSGFAFSHASLYAGGFVHHQAAALCWVRRDEVPHWEEGRVIHSRGAIRSALGVGVTNLSGELPGSNSYGELELAINYARRVSTGVQSGLRLRVLQASGTPDSSGESDPFSWDFGFWNGLKNGGLALDFGIEGSSGSWRAGGVARAVISSLNWERSQDGPIPRGFDIGVERRIGEGIRALAGTTLTTSWLPRRLAIGAAWRPPRTPLSLYGGPALTDIQGESRMELSAGLGASVGAFKASYAFRTGPPGLGEIHRFALRVNLP